MAIDREKVLQNAQKFVEKKKYDKAVLEYQKIIQEDPNDARVLLKLGDIQAKMGAFEQAVATYERVGKQYAAQGFALKAIAVYKQIREIITKHIPQVEEKYAHLVPKLADLYQQLGLTSDALAMLDELATKHQRAGRDDEAIALFRRLVDLEPQNPLTHLRLAEGLARHRDVDGAVAEFGVAASQLVKLGRRDDALKVFERLLQQKPDVVHARIAAELYISRGAPSDGMLALAKLQLCFQANPKDLDTLALLARAFSLIGQEPKAVEVQKEMARIAKEQGKDDIFRELIQKLLRAAPHDEVVQQLAGMRASAGMQAAAPAPAPAAAPSSRRAPTAPPPLPPRSQAPTGSVSAAGSLGTGSLPASMGPGSLRSPSFGASMAPEDVDEDELEEVEDFEEIDDDDVDELADVDGMMAAAAEMEAAEIEVAESVTGLAAARRASSAPPAPTERAMLPASPAPIAQIMADAESYRRARLYDRCVALLRTGISATPSSLELRVALRDALLEAERTEEAVDEMLAIAGVYIDALDHEGAAQALQHVLTVDPTNARAIELLRDLGYDVIDEPGSVPDSGYAIELPQDRQYQPYDIEPLPAYELEPSPPPPATGSYAGSEYAGPSYTSSSYSYSGGSYSGGSYSGGSYSGAPPNTLPPNTLPPNSKRLVEIDDPFGQDAPLPSFPLDELPEEPSRASYRPVDPRGVDLRGPDIRRGLDTGSHPGSLDLGAASSARFPSELPTRSSGSVSSARLGASPELEEALDEADFFASRGLVDDARAVLQDQLARLPNHPLILDRLAELDNHAGRDAGMESGAREMPRATDAAGGMMFDKSFDIAASLDALEGFDGPTAEAAPYMDGEQQVDVEEVFAKFKEGVAKQISVDDSQAHYDLAVAYKEMGLLEDAIREFELAARDARKECLCQSMIGMIHVERGNLNEAIDAFMRGLHAAHRTAEEEVALSYELGQAYEAKRMSKEALNYYQRCAKKDPSFRDVQDRIRRLSVAAKPQLRAAVGADDDFDRAFDDLLTGGKS